MTPPHHDPPELPTVQAITPAGEPDILLRIGIDSTDEHGAAVLVFIEVKGSGQAAAIPLVPWQAQALAGYLTEAAAAAAGLALGGDE